MSRVVRTFSCTLVVSLLLLVVVVVPFVVAAAARSDDEDQFTSFTITPTGQLQARGKLPSISKPSDLHNMRCSAYDSILYLLIEVLTPLEEQRRKEGAEAFKKKVRESDVLVLIDDFCAAQGKKMGLRIYTTADFLGFVMSKLGTDLLWMAKDAGLNPETATEAEVVRMLTRSATINVPLTMVPNATVAPLFAPEHMVATVYMEELSKLAKQRAAANRKKNKNKADTLESTAAAGSIDVQGPKGTIASTFLLPQILQGEWISGFWLSRCGAILDDHEDDVLPLMREGGLSGLVQQARKSWFPRDCVIGVDPVFMAPASREQLRNAMAESRADRAKKLKVETDPTHHNGDL